MIVLDFDAVSRSFTLERSLRFDGFFGGCRVLVLYERETTKVVHKNRAHCVALDCEEAFHLRNQPWSFGHQLVDANDVSWS